MGKIIDKFKNPTTKFGQYLLNNFIALDQTWNARTGGDPDETVSSRLGKLQRAGKLPKWRIFSRALVALLDGVDQSHCRKAIEKDEGKNAIIDRVDES